jgi:hypothetical protein
VAPKQSGQFITLGGQVGLGAVTPETTRPKIEKGVGDFAHICPSNFLNEQVHLISQLANENVSLNGTYRRRVATIIITEIEWGVDGGEF